MILKSESDRLTLYSKESRALLNHYAQTLTTKQQSALDWWTGNILLLYYGANFKISSVEQQSCTFITFIVCLKHSATEENCYLLTLASFFTTQLKVTAINRHRRPVAASIYGDNNSRRWERLGLVLFLFLSPFCEFSAYKTHLIHSRARTTLM